MDSETRTAYRSVFAMLEESGPKPLSPRLELQAEDLEAEATVAVLIQHIQEADPNDAVKVPFSMLLWGWDAAAEDVEWVQGTAKWSQDRRNLSYELLGLDAEYWPIVDQSVSLYEKRELVIAKSFEPWYTSQRQQEEGFYWPAYKQYLMDKPGWEPRSIVDLDSATSDIVRRLSDPARSEAYQSKGLVVGYVQSGKTANISGVIAKAVDSGYRLIIVMTGLINLLRRQTQRRIDMELVGYENILGGIDPEDPEMMETTDYYHDPDWPDKFVHHGELPYNVARPNIIRLTKHQGDYASLRAGISALEFERRDQTLPLYNVASLQHCSARLVIVKKNKPVLNKLVRDLKAISPKLNEVPALIIDDESDHASINTSDPDRWEEGRTERTAINASISELLRLLPRSQYVGYTATPFANVFIDPTDVEDIFPKDFIIALARPPGYMGARDFHDFEAEMDDEGVVLRGPNERTFVRDLIANRDDKIGRRAELKRAMGMFVLTGAMKLYRADKSSLNFRHHTMLAHESVRRRDHEQLAADIRSVWLESDFSSPSGFDYLRDLWLEDVHPTSSSLGDELLPEDVEVLKPYVGAAITEIMADGDPVIVVNSDQDITNESLDFDKERVWRILVGGAKLSRGFTIEGLTISYYRRRAYNSDSLMQMGRWFGFRRGYRDLVRLFIDRGSGVGQDGLDLYEAFGSISRAEEQFRDEVEQYSELVNGVPQVTPAEFPPLVTQHLPWLRPTARNKMFNATLDVRRMSSIEPVAYPIQGLDIAANYDFSLPLLSVADSEGIFGSPRGRYPVRFGSAAHSEIISCLQKLKWLSPDYFLPDLAFLEEMDEAVDDWIVVMPQRAGGANCVLPELGERSCFSRRRSRGADHRTLFHNLSDPKHRFAARRIAGFPDEPAYDDLVVDRLCDEARGAMLIYPVVEHDIEATGGPQRIRKSECVVAFHIVPPYTARRRHYPYVQFKVRNEAQRDQIVVPNV